MSDSLSTALRTVANSLQIPVIMILLLLIALVIILFGSLIAEIFTERRLMKAVMPEMVDKLRDCLQIESDYGYVGKAAADMTVEKNIIEVIENSGLLRRQKAALRELTAHEGITPLMRESLAVRLIHEEKTHYDRILRISDLVARLAPVFGLLGTLIPLGPGIIALGQGDTYTLSLSLLTAFDTTVAGLISAAGAYFISAVRRAWYSDYMSALEMSMECVLEVLKTDIEDRQKEC